MQLHHGLCVWICPLDLWKYIPRQYFWRFITSSLWRRDTWLRYNVLPEWKPFGRIQKTEGNHSISVKGWVIHSLFFMPQEINVTFFYVYLKSPFWPNKKTKGGNIIFKVNVKPRTMCIKYAIQWINKKLQSIRQTSSRRTLKKYTTDLQTTIATVKPLNLDLF